MLCGPWLDVGDLTLCAEGDFEPGALAKALAGANELLYIASCRTFPGVCTDTVRPCGYYSVGGGGTWGWGSSFPVLADGSRWIPWGIESLLGLGAPGFGGCGCGGVESCGCTVHSAVVVPGDPIIDVTEITVDGTVVDPSLYALVDRRKIVRTDGEWWPCCQHVERAATEDGTFSVSYRYGAIPGQALLLALEVLACELATGWANDGECRLPRRLTSLVREGVSMAVLDPLQFLNDRKFGIYEVDAALAAFDCAAAAERPGDLVSVVGWDRSRRTS